MPYQQEFLLQAYRTMKTIRLFEERVVKEFERGNIPGFTHVYDGQEAIATGVCTNLTDRDWIGSTHRGHGHCIAKGCDVIGMMKEIMGRSTGLCHGKGGSMHIADFDKGMLGANAIVGGAPPLCIGAALTAKTRGTGDVSVSFNGDGSSNQGTVFESMNMAVVLKLPTVFVFENNGYGEKTGIKYAVGADITERTAAFGMPSKKVDGIDFFAVYEAVQEAVEHARKGGGPSAVEAVAPRFSGHFVGDPQLYRPKGEIKRLRAEMDCLKAFRERVVNREKWLTSDQLDALDSEVAALIEQAAQEALKAPRPTEADLLTDVYSSY